jgi:hypothetical protein
MRTSAEAPSGSPEKETTAPKARNAWRPTRSAAPRKTSWAVQETHYVVQLDLRFCSAKGKNPFALLHPSPRPDIPRGTKPYRHHGSHPFGMMLTDEAGKRLCTSLPGRLSMGCRTPEESHPRLQRKKPKGSGMFSIFKGKDPRAPTSCPWDGCSLSGATPYQTLLFAGRHREGAMGESAPLFPGSYSPQTREGSPLSPTHRASAP